MMYIGTMVAMGGHAAHGDVIGGRYRIEACVGQGNMAMVYRAVHLGTKQPCALKLIHPHLLTQPHVRELFVQEAQVGSRIGKNPYIVDVFDAGIDVIFNVPFLAMELLEGDTLQKYVEQHGPMPPGLLRTLFTQLGDALDQAHSVGVVHRDLKPGNLFLTYDRKRAPVLKVVDFGIAKIMEEGAQGTATQVGSPAYAAPEQIAASMQVLTDKLGITIARTISPATDIWALGMIAYELLLGTPPGHLWNTSGRATLSDIVLGVVIQPLPSIVERAANKAHLLPRGFEEWLARCLKKNAAERWPSVGEATLLLVDLLDTGFEDRGTTKIHPQLLDGIVRKATERAASVPPSALVSNPLPSAYGKTDVLPRGPEWPAEQNESILLSDTDLEHGVLNSAPEPKKQRHSDTDEIPAAENAGDSSFADSNASVDVVDFVVEVPHDTQAFGIPHEVESGKPRRQRTVPLPPPSALRTALRAGPSPSVVPAPSEEARPPSISSARALPPPLPSSRSRMEPAAPRRLPPPLPPPPARTSSPSMIALAVTNGPTSSQVQTGDARTSIPYPMAVQSLSEYPRQTPTNDPKTPPGVTATGSGFAATHPPIRTITRKGRVAVLGGLTGMIAIIWGVMSTIPKNGRLHIGALNSPGAPSIDMALVFIDGTKQCEALPCTMDVKPGARLIEVRPKGMAPLPPQTVTIESGQEKSINLIASSSSKHVEPTAKPAPIPEKTSLSIHDLPNATPVPRASAPKQRIVSIPSAKPSANATPQDLVDYFPHRSADPNN